MTGLDIIPVATRAVTVDLTHVEDDVREFIESSEDTEWVVEANRRLGGLAGYYDRDSPAWKAAQRLERRTEKRLDQLLPPPRPLGDLLKTLQR